MKNEQAIEILYEKGYEDGFNADKWISVKDRLPNGGIANPDVNYSQEYICALDFYGNKKYFVSSMTFDREGNWVNGELNYNGYVTHWQHLPTAPKGE